MQLLAQKRRALEQQQRELQMVNAEKVSICYPRAPSFCCRLQRELASQLHTQPLLEFHPPEQQQQPEQHDLSASFDDEQQEQQEQTEGEPKEEGDGQGATAEEHEQEQEQEQAQSKAEQQPEPQPAQRKAKTIASDDHAQASAPPADTEETETETVDTKHQPQAKHTPPPSLAALGRLSNKLRSLGDEHAALKVYKGVTHVVTCACLGGIVERVGGVAEGARAADGRTTLIGSTTTASEPQPSQTAEC